MTFVEIISSTLSALSLLGVLANFLILLLRISKNLGKIQENFVYVLNSIKGQMGSYGKLISALAKAKVLSSQDVEQIAVPYMNMAQDPINRLLNKIAPTGNPISVADTEKLRDYVGRVQKGQLLNPVEAQEFYNLSKKLEEEESYKMDVGTAFLIGLAAFLLGLAIGSNLKK